MIQLLSTYRLLIPKLEEITLHNIYFYISIDHYFTVNSLFDFKTYMKMLEFPPVYVLGSMYRFVPHPLACV